MENVNVKDGWQAEIHGRVFESGKGPVLQPALGIDEKELSASERAIFASRARLFFDDSERGKEIGIVLHDRRYKLPRSRENGHFAGTVRIPGSTANVLAGASRSMTFELMQGSTGLGRFQAKFIFSPRRVDPSSPTSS